MSQTVGIRLFTKEDSLDQWKDIPIVSYMPVFLKGDDNIPNVEKRIRLRFLNHDPSIIKARWHYKDDPENGYWVDQEDS